MADIPRLTIRCEYPNTDLPPTEVTFRLSPSYGLTTGHEANEWFIEMLRDHEEFEVETDRAGELPLSFWTETVRGVMVAEGICPQRFYVICTRLLRSLTYKEASPLAASCC